MQDLESTQLMIDMLERPKAFWGHCQRYAGSLIMQIAFNKRANRNTDPAVADMVRLLGYCSFSSTHRLTCWLFLARTPRGTHCSSCSRSSLGRLPPMAQLPSFRSCTMEADRKANLRQPGEAFLRPHAGRQTRHFIRSRCSLLRQVYA